MTTRPYRQAQATGVVLPEPTRCRRETEDGPCVVDAPSCTCRVPEGCAEDYPGCCFCAHLDVYQPCPTFGFGCGPGCDCCTPFQQRQVFRQSQPRPLSKPEDYYEPDPFADENGPSDGAQ